MTFRVPEETLPGWTEISGQPLKGEYQVRIRFTHLCLNERRLDPRFQNGDHVVKYIVIHSKACPTIVESMPIYWHLDDLLDDIQGARGDFAGGMRDVLIRGSRTATT
jgi:hypothetical protein